MRGVVGGLSNLFVHCVVYTPCSEERVAGGDPRTKEKKIRDMLEGGCKTEGEREKKRVMWRERERESESEREREIQMVNYRACESNRKTEVE